MHAEITWQGNVHFLAEGGSGHTVPMDGPPESGGQDKGTRPMELLLMGVGGCTSYDVVNILAKSRQQVTDCVTKMDAVRSDEVPQVFERIHIHFVVTGHDLDDKKVERAVKLSADKYCSASIMLQRAGVKITHGYEIVEAA